MLEEEDIAVGGERGREMRNDVALSWCGHVVTVGHLGPLGGPSGPILDAGPLLVPSPCSSSESCTYW